MEVEAGHQQAGIAAVVATAVAVAVAVAQLDVVYIANAVAEDHSAAEAVPVAEEADHSAAADIEHSVVDIGLAAAAAEVHSAAVDTAAHWVDLDTVPAAA